MATALLLFTLAACASLAPGLVCPIGPAGAVATDRAVEAGDLVELRATALGADLALAIFGPGGEPVERIDERRSNDSFEELAWIAGATGVYRVEIRSLSATPGAYRWTQVSRRPAAPADRERVAAVRDQRSIRVALQGSDAASRRAAESAAAALVERLVAAGESERALAVRRFTARAAELDRDPERAAALLDGVVADATALGADREAAYAIDQQALIAWKAGSFESALALGRRAIAAADRSDYAPIRAQTRANFGMAAVGTGRYDEGVAAHREALALHTRLGDLAGMARDRFNLGAAAYEHGELDTALAAFEDARRDFADLDDSRSLILVLSNLAAAAADLGQPERSVELLRRSLDLPHGDDPDTARHRAAALVNLGESLAELGRTDEAEEREREAEQLARDRGFEDRRASALLARCELRLDRGRYADALPLAREAEALARSSAQPSLIAGALRALGRALAGTGDLDGARRALDEGLGVATALGLAEEEIRLRLERARLEQAAGEAHAALDQVRAALPVVERIRSGLASGLDRATFLDSVGRLYRLGVELELELDASEPGGGHLESAFALAERGRARALQDLLDPTRSPHPSAEARAVHDRAAELVATQRRLLAASGGPARERSDLERRLEVVSGELERARAALVRAAPREASRLEPSAPVSLAEVRRALAPGSALAEYVVDDRFAAVFLVRRSGVAVHRLADGRRIAAAVEALSGQLAAPSLLGASAFAQRSAELEALVLGPAAPALAGIETLFVSPDGPLHRVPFAALVEGRASGAAYRDLPYLVRRMTVVRVPSVSAMAALARRPRAPRPPAPPLVAIGDPDLPSTGAPGAPARALLELDPSQLRPLPASGLEIEGAATLFPGSLVLRGARATEARVKSELALASARRVHFATHGVISERRPDLSAIVLAPGAPDQDGLLQAWEIADLKLDADLVVLSSCRSALGRSLSGEGFLGLTQAVFEAGAHAVVATLAPVDDEATARFMLDFYRHLARAERPELALAAAQRDALAAGGLDAHPASWAPFVLFAGLPGLEPQGR